MSDSKKRKKVYYTQSSNKRKCFRLDAGMKGFLITCNNTEKRAVQESYNLLNEYADLMFGPEKKTVDADEGPLVDDDDFESAIRKELQEIHAQKTSTTKRFQVVDTKTTNCVFIKTTLEKPDELVSKILTDVYETHVTKSRFILKLFPVLGTCRATMDKIEKLAEAVLEPFLKPIDEDVKLTYCTIYKVRNNNLSRDDILPVIGRVALQLNPSIKVNFDQPDLVVSVDVLQKFCCISVMTKFFQFRKYNVQEISKINSAPNPDSKNDCSGLHEEGAVEVTVPLPVVEAVANDNARECVINGESQSIGEAKGACVDQDTTRECVINGEGQNVTEDKGACVDQDTNGQITASDLPSDLDQSSVNIHSEKPNE